MERIFFSGDAYYASLVADISQAKRSVEFESYIFDLDRVGKNILATMEESAKRGVKVRVLIDGVGASNWLHADFLFWRGRGIEVRAFHPMPWQMRSDWLLSFLNVIWVRNFFARLNRRNHRKACIIDEEIAYVGGMNVSETHSEQYSLARAWRDTMVRLDGPSIGTLHRAFEAAWRNTHSRIFLPHMRWPHRNKERMRRSLVYLNDTRSHRRAKFRDLERRIRNADKRIWLTTPYFVPPPRILRALMIASSRGKDVRILTGYHTSPAFMNLVGKTFYPTLQSAGIRVFEYMPSILHSKTMMIDGWVTVGSSNYNYRSFIHDLEVDIRIAQRDSLQKIEAQFLEDLEKSREVRPIRWIERLWLTGILQRVLLQFRFWI